MKNMIFLAVLSFGSTLLAATGPCNRWENWSEPPISMDCDGTEYVLGFASCDGGESHQSFFCSKGAAGSVESCRTEESTEKSRCGRKLFERRTGALKREIKDVDPCLWINDDQQEEPYNRGREKFKCEGQDFVGGRAQCRSGLLGFVFCKAEFGKSGQLCAMDESALTKKCEKKFKLMQIKRMMVDPSEIDDSAFGVEGPETGKK